MPRGLYCWLHRQAARLGRGGRQRSGPGRGANSQFLAHLAETGSRQVDVDHYEASLRRRRLGRGLLLCLLGAGGAWVVIESARAISMF